jgi:hypothetical protein
VNTAEKKTGFPGWRFSCRFRTTLFSAPALVAITRLRPRIHVDAFLWAASGPAGALRAPSNTSRVPYSGVSRGFPGNAPWYCLGIAIR